ncbi:chloride channel protein [Pedobacter yulinensis]|uniref:Chloride channel protein n=1 Tax=Pedobacter yulinensis TaxID=2126353 RepID=A0A2T3HLJ9_9SPHI|nr:chloride channel protein [Pedobacter yulinensis]PST83304.1 chloride channel protein [Pedobacter yulinensis]
MYESLTRAVNKINSYRKTKISNRNFLVFAAVVVGILSGLAAALLKSLTHHIEDFLQTGFHWQYKYYLYLLFPFIGILLSVLYVRRFIVKGKFETGLTPLLRSISGRSSRVEFHNIYSQIITAAVTVGFGGSTGLEAPVVTSGSSIGSNLGRFLGLSYREVTLLLACGAAGAIAGAFNSPIAGIVFAIEILLPEFTIPVFIPLLLASATASVVARLFYSEQLFYIVSQGWETKALIWYVILACLIGLFSIYFIKANQAVKSFFYRIKSPYRRVVVGGLALGALVFLFPTLYGEGYVTIKNLLLGDYNSVINNSIFSSYNEFPAVLLLFTLLTVFAKSIATLVTLGAGGNGGTFAPSLIIGGLLGFTLAYTINLTGLAHVNVGNFIVAGMAAALGSIMHAPLTGIFLIAEITGGYILMVPLMITTAISYLISRSYQKHSIYAKPLADAGELMSHEDKDTTVLRMMKLKYLIEKDFSAVEPQEQVRSRLSGLFKSRHNIYPVLTEERVFLGLVYAEDLFQQVLKNNAEQPVIFSELMQPAPQVLAPDTELQAVLAGMENEQAWLLPVVDSRGVFLGFVSKTAIFNKYRALLARQADYLA